MRISDRMLSRNYINNISSQKSEVEKLRSQIASQKRVSKPSDDPKSAARIINLSGQFESSNKYLDNISKSITFLQETTTTMESILNEISRIDVKLTEIQNSALNGNENIYANELELSIDTLLDLANQKFDGKYIFGGTDYSNKPFEYANGKAYIKQNTADIGGELKVKISPNLTQKINVTGAELFGSIVKFDGNLDKTASTGATVSNTQTVYDVDGNSYNLITTFTKTASNTYQLAYDVKDSSGNSVFSSAPDAIEFTFDSSTNTIKTINGISPKTVSVNALSGKISFNLDLRNLTEKNSSTNIESSINQKMDIFNVLIKLKEQIKAGKQPDSEYVQAVKDFHKKVIGKLSEVGTVTNRMTDNELILQNQQTNLQEVIANEQEVDLVDAISQMQYYDYLLQVSYKMSSMILPKSILDFI